MKILVCAKFVPDPDHLSIAEGRDGKVVVDGFPECRMNRFDEFAVEAAVRIKEALHGVTIDVVTVGAARSGDVLRRAMGMGADSGILLETGDHYVSPLTTAAAIADYARGKAYTLVIAGAMSEDAMNGQVGPMVAAFLGFPAATQVIHMELVETATGSAGICVEREIEGGSREMLEIDLPAVLAVQTGINEPRYPSLSNLLKANKQELETITLGLAENGAFKGPDQPASLVMPKKMRAGRHIGGSAVEKAEALLSILREKALIK